MMILLDPDLDPDRRPRSRTALPDATLPTSRTLTRFLRDAQAAVRLRGQVSVLLTTDREIRRLNRQFRGKDKATDVLSFPAGFNDGAEKLAGDLAISVDTARKQAVAQGHALSAELKVLMLHGLLHLAGYDHETDDGRMARRERLLRARLGLPVGLIERAAAPALAPERRNGARTRKAKAGPSTRSLRELAQDDSLGGKKGASRGRRK